MIKYFIISYPNFHSTLNNAFADLKIIFLKIKLNSKFKHFKTYFNFFLLENLINSIGLKPKSITLT